MMFRAFCAAAAIVVAVPAAHAQQFSDSYEFLQAVRKADGAKVTDILKQPGVSIINTKDRTTGEGALHIVAHRSDDVYLRFLLQQEANPNIQDARGNTPLMIAVERSFAAGIDILLRYKANVDLANASGETPLIRAVQMRNLEFARELLAAGADPDRADTLAGMSARDYARADTRSPAMAKLLADAPKIDKARVSGPRL